MIKFRQKMYVAPLAMLGGSTAMNVIGGLGLVQGGAGMIQANQQMKQAEQHQQQNVRLQKQQMKVEQQKADAINNLANSPAGQTSQGQAVQQGLFSNRELKNQKLFAYSWKDVVGFGKDVGNHIWKNKGHVAGFLGFGALMTGGKYLADKAIQQDKSIAINNKNKKEEKVYSDNTPKKNNKSAGSKAGIGATLGVGLVMGAVTPLASYAVDKIQQKKLAERSNQKSFSRSIFQKGLDSIKRSGWNSRQNMKVINNINNSESTFYNPKTWKWLKKVGHNPVRGIANVYNSFNMMGGETGMKSFKNSLRGKGSSGSKLSKDVSKFMDKHGATSMAAIGAIGGGALFKGSELAEKGTEKALRALDKNAFKYTDSKEENID